MSGFIGASFEHAQLSMAAYANFTEGMPNDAFREALKNNGFSDVQAATFVSTYSVVKVFNDPATNFSATLFQKRGSSEKVLAIRGTESWQDLFISDLQIGVFGLTNQYQTLRNFLPQLVAQLQPGDSLTVTGHSLGGFLAQVFALDNQTFVSHAYTTNTPGLGGVLFNPLGLFGVAGEVVPNPLITNLIAEGPSFVASQGRQFGTPYNVFIEQSQNPLDNHGKMSITDALALYDVFATVDPTLDIQKITDILESASPASDRSLESALDVLRKIMQGSDITSTPIYSPFDEGGTSMARNTYYANLIQLRDTPALSGSYRIDSLAGMPSSAVFSQAKATTLDGLAYRYALRELNPFVVTGIDYTASHNQDQSLNLYNPTTGEGTWTLVALSDRAELLAERLGFNTMDGPGSVSLNNSRPTHFADMTTNFEVGTTFPHTNDVIFGTAQDDRDIEGRTKDDHLYGGLGNDVLRGLGGRDYLEGNAGDDEIYGGDESDILLGQQGLDYLDGGVGADRMSGGTGNDKYVVDNAGDVVTEFTGGGNDEVYASVNYALASHVENLILTGTGNTSGTGNDLDNHITGNAGNNRLAGKGGTDLLEGGAGFDTYIYNLGDGTDRIEDSDAQGQIIFDGRLLQGGIRRAGDAANTYTSLDGRTTYVMSNSDLIVNGVLIVNENFQSGQMGIQLRDVSSLPSRQQQSVIYERSISGTDADNYVTDGLSPYSNDILEGFGGRDILESGNGYDALYGGEGDDLLLDWSVGGPIPWNDLLDGGDGNDYLRAGLGDDVLLGGGGNDFLLGGRYSEVLDETGRDYLDGGAGDDYLWGAFADDVLIGGEDDDILRGDNLPGDIPVPYFLEIAGYTLAVPPNPSVWVVSAVGGADYLDGGAGNDLLVGDGGDDILIGGAGNDTLYGESDFAPTVPGNDWLDGGEGNDRLFGGAGADLLSGGDGDDLLIGDFSDDPGSADILDGGAGADELQGGGGDDILYGGIGMDRLAGFAGNDFLDGGADSDELQGGTGDDSLWGGMGDDRLTGQEGNDSLFGDEGDDLLVGDVGNDTLLGGEGQDGLFGNEGGDLLAGEAGDDLLNGGLGNDELDGGEGIDDVQGREGDDLVVGGAGDDSLYGDGNDPTVLNLIGGNDTLDGEEGADQLWGGAGQDQLFGGDGADQLVGDVGDDVLFGDAGNDSLFGDSPFFPNEAGADVLDGGEGNDVLQGGGGNDRLEGGAGNDVLFGELVGDLTTAAGEDVLEGGTGNDSLVGGGGRDTYLFNVGDGADTIFDASGEGNRLVFGAGIRSSEVTIGIGAEDSLIVRLNETGDAVQIASFGTGNFAGPHPIDRFEFADGTTLTYEQLVARGFDLRGTIGNDQIFGTNQQDQITGGTGDDRLFGLAGPDQVRGDEGDDVLFGGEGADVLDGGLGQDQAFGEQGADRLIGGEGNDSLFGGDGDDVLQGGNGNDQLDGGSGADQLFGGDGDDVIVIDADDTLVDGGAGIDTISFQGFAGVAFDLGASHFEQAQGTEGDDTLLAASASGPVQIFGQGGDDTLVGGVGHDLLAGGEGADTLVGGVGNDMLDGDLGDDTYIFALGHGQDTINDLIARESFDDDGNLVTTVEHNRVVFGAGITPDSIRPHIDLTLFSSPDSTGTLLLSVGATDSLALPNFDPSNLSGPHAIETFQFEDGSSFTYDQVLERGFDISGTGADDAIHGTTADDRIDGGAGNDVLRGGEGNDAYLFGRGSGQDVVVDQKGTFDTVRLAADVMPADVTVVRNGYDMVLGIVGTTDRLTLSFFFLAPALQVERVIFGDGTVWDATFLRSRTEGGLQGTDGPDLLHGTAGNDVLDGGAGADVLEGGLGNDRYFVDDAGDVVIEQANEGIDTIQSSVSRSLEASVENLTLMGSAVINGTGNGLDNVLTGNGAANVLTGGAGNDIYVVGAGDMVVELPGEGIDTIESEIGYTLGANLENLTLIGNGAINGVGNELDNVIRGNASPNVFIGGRGNDTYFVEAGDTVVEYSGEGVDTIETTSSYRLGANLEHLVLRDEGPSVLVDGLSLTGNELDNVLMGNRYANVLDGDLGADVLIGGSGDDIYVVDDIGDLVVEDLNSGYDTVVSFVDFTLGANVEALSLGDGLAQAGTGNELNNTLSGNANSNILDGRAGDDSLFGGLGQDTYLFGHGSGRDTVADTNIGEVDTILMAPDVVPSDVVITTGYPHSLVSLVIRIVSTGDDLTIPDFFQGPAYQQTKVVQFADGTVWDGDALALRASAYPRTDRVGSPFDDTMSGGIGDDRLLGYLGNDQLNGGAGNDELQGGYGNDLLRGGLGDDRLYGNTFFFNGIPAEDSDALFGEEGNDSLFGDDGNDVLDGGAGGDSLFGEAGNDVLIGGPGYDTLDGGLGDDVYVFGRGSGQDVAFVGGNDVIRFTADVVPSDVTVSRSNIVMFLRIDGTQDVILTYFSADDPSLRIGQVEFADGTIWDQATLFQKALSIVGTDGADFLDGTTAQETMSGGLGDDTYHRVEAHDIIMEAAGAGTDTVIGLDGVTLSANVENLTLYEDGTQTGGAIRGTGNALDNILLGNHADNVLDGGDGNDTLIGGFVSFDELGGVHGDGNDILIGGDGDDYLEEGFGEDLLIGGRGNDTYLVSGGQGSIVEGAGEGTDGVITGSDYTLGENLENLRLVGIANVNGTGNELNNLLIGNSANNVLEGGGGDDVLWGGSDLIPEFGVITSGNDQLLGGTGNDTYLFNLGDGFDTIVDTAVLGEGNRIQFGAGIARADLAFTHDQMARTLTIEVGGGGADQLVLVNFDPTGGNGSLVVTTLAFADGSTANLANLLGPGVITGTGGDDVLTGTTGNDTIDALGGNDAVSGLAGDDSILGGDGNDVLNGGIGADVLTGGPGNDTYVVDDPSDVVTELTNEGLDTVQASISYSLGTSVENLTLTGTANLNGMGNELTNVLTGSSGDNMLNGGVGADTLLGGVGDDIYIVDDVNDVVTEVANEGTDTVQSSVTYALGANLENLMLTGTGAINGTGNQLDNVLTGNSAANTLAGGVGNDTYVVSTGDTVVEAANQGLDRVMSDGTWTLGANLENLTLTGTAPINGTGNSLTNILTGNSANNVLNGGTGADALLGGQGNDTYVVDNVGDVVTEQANEGTDTVQASISYGLGANVENLTLTGAGAITGTGNSLNNTLTGNSAANMLTGGTGDDLYLVGAGDSAVEQLNEGLDTVQSAITWTLGANLENLTLTGSAVINGTGNSLNNVLTGNNAANVLDGGAGDDRLTGGGGADTLLGGTGDDTYLVDNVGDVVTESVDEGLDRVQSTVTYTLSANVENLLLTGTGTINGIGNSQNNVLTGNSAANVLVGGAGADTLVGGLGNDTYVVDDIGDVVTENLNEGTDTVQASITYAIGANVENLVLAGTTAINGTGNTANNVLTGNSAANVLDGGTGTDTLKGGQGDDTYIVDDTTDVVTELLNEGTDTVQSSINYTVGANVENLTLTGGSDLTGTGNSLNNVLIGNGGANTLNGGIGADTLMGGQGDDRYLIDNVGDVVTEELNEGVDTVQSSVTYTLSANVEHLILAGSAAINGMGNSLDNILTGNAGANVLDGGAGADTLIGGRGNDTYVVDGVGDVVTENLNEGTDTVQASISYTLGVNLENLALTGTATIDGTGNALNNVLTGNSAANTLSGGDGNDTLDGGSGADSLVGGLGNDTYIVDDVNDLVTEALNEGTDTVQSSVSYTLSPNMENLILTGPTAINGIGNALNNVLTGNSAVNILTGGTGNDTYVVSAGDTVIENANEGIDTVQSDVNWTLGANLENLTLTGVAAINGTGNSLANTLRGNSAANVLAGGLGNDTYVVSTGDSIIEHANEGTDTVQSDVSWILGANLEKLTLTGTASIDGTGNALNNTVTGNSAANMLIGGAGNDTLRGSLGNDTYLINRGDGQDVVSENDGTVGNTDTLLYGTTINPQDLILSRQANDLRLSVYGTSDQVTIQNWYLGDSYQTEVIQAGNGQQLMSTQVNQLIQAMAGFTQQTGLSWEQAVAQRPQDVQQILAANWQ